jgi:hypothetical protein
MCVFHKHFINVKMTMLWYMQEPIAQANIYMQYKPFNIILYIL